MTGEGIVAAVVRGHGHDGTCAVSGQHIVADIDGNLLARKRVDGIRAGKHARYLLVNHALALGLVLDRVEILVDGLALPGGGDHIHVLALGGENHECHAEHSVGAGGEYEQVEVIPSGDGKTHLGAFRASDPVALGLL